MGELCILAAESHSAFAALVTDSLCHCSLLYLCLLVDALIIQDVISFVKSILEGKDHLGAPMFYFWIRSMPLIAFW